LPKYTGWFVVLTFAGEIALAGGIPLLMVMQGAKFYELEAGATHLHAFVLWSVFSTIRFADYLYSGRRMYLLEAVLPVIFYVLLVYRGPAIICVVSWLFLYVIKNNGVRWKHGAAAAAAGLLLFYLNGVIGDVRSPGHEAIGGPSQSFRDSGIPQTYFWTYLYATVAMANFQLSVNKLTPGRGSTGEFIAADLLPDTISKRILPLLNPRINSRNLASRDQLYSWEQPQVSVGLNISTMYGRSYGFFGWLGPVIIFSAFSLFIVIYLLLARRSPYRVPCLALLNTFAVFCLFNNMLASAAMLPLLILPLLLPPWRAAGRKRPALPTVAPLAKV
jgi:hypothetical protein